MSRSAELLAPAGSRAALIGAVAQGADAVYMGGRLFNARRGAENFDDAALADAVRYAHLYGVKVYIALNITIKESELAQMDAFLALLSELRVDGVIVQDLGAARTIAAAYPELPLHASTQMTIHQWEGAALLKEMGFARVVLARELSLTEIREISEKTDLALEVFVHGALCAGYSGQCLMSSFLGGRSGNRGLCAQPCRLPYLLGSAKGHPLSTRDLSALSGDPPLLLKILEIGVTALKIEGRMKRPEYTAVVTGVYRRALDALQAGQSIRDLDQERRALLQIFNRGGFTQGYFPGQGSKGVMNPGKPNHQGVVVGHVAVCRGTDADIRLQEALSPEDTLVFRLQREEIAMPAGPMTAKGRLVAKGTPGMTVTMKVRRPVPQGTPVYRTVQAAQLAEAQALMSQPYRRKIPVQAVFKAQIGALPELTLTDPQGVIAKVCGEASAQQATASGWTQADLARQLSKLGDTPFVFETCRIEAESGLFLPVSALNALRRAAAEALMQARIRRFEDRGERPCRTARKHAALLPESPLADQPSLAGYVEDLNLPLEVFAGLDIVAYDPRRWPIDGDAVLPWVKALKQKGYSVRLVLPRITRSADMELLRRTPENLWNCFDEVMAGNLGQMKLMKDLGVIGILTDFSFNITNSRALAHLKDLGAAGAVLSTELTTAEIRDIIRRRCLPCEILVFGRMPLLISEACLKDRRYGCGECAEGGTELIDRMGYRFPVLTRIAARCYTEIYNSVWTFTAEDCAALLAAGADGWGLRLSGLTTRQIPDIIALYRHGRSHPNTPLPKPLQQASEAVKAMGFTRGRFFRRIE